MTVSTAAGRKPALDAVAAAAVEQALQAAIDVAPPGGVGEHLGVTADGDRVVTHRFASTARGYRGWYWAVTLARAPRARAVTVSEVVLLPGEGSIMAPEWLPWSDRLQPGDLGAADVLPRLEEDPRLEPGLEATGVAHLGVPGGADEDVDAVARWELGLGRVRVLSALGRGEAADRWYAGEGGPDSEEAEAAAARCATCGFFLPLPGSLRQLFGVCTNEWAAADGRVVSLDHGCGAHSETDVEPSSVEPLPPAVLDELATDEL